MAKIRLLERPLILSIGWFKSPNSPNSSWLRNSRSWRRLRIVLDLVLGVIVFRLFVKRHFQFEAKSSTACLDRFDERMDLFPRSSRILRQTRSREILSAKIFQSARDKSVGSGVASARFVAASSLK
jgi:hypothetical protein